MKAAPVWQAIAKFKLFKQFLLHTGQHYDNYMSDIFFKELNLPEPDYNLSIGSKSHAHQTAAIMMNLEDLFLKIKPNMIIVYGDVNSTVAATLVCSKIGIPVAHVEAGLRSFDRRMPEEINRLVTDQLSDLLFTPSKDADVNLAKEGIEANKIHFVGNVMIDTLIKLNNKTSIPDEYKAYNEYILITMHRPSNVDNISNLTAIFESLLQVNKSHPIIFPIHPRTKRILDKNNLYSNYSKKIDLIEPLGYLEFLGLMKNAKAVITDSGGIQEETTWLGIPCLTVRENTERPITISIGTNKLIGIEYQKIPYEIRNIKLDKKHGIPPLWDGNAAERIAKVIKDYLTE
jgi:UDP-N-acetylglucosamine 2-epimerase (non-hydrolysing)